MEERCVEDRGHHLLEVVTRQCREKVLVGDHFPLLRDLDLAVEHSPRLGEDRRVRGSASTADRSPATVEEP